MAEASSLLAGPDRAQAGHQPEASGLRPAQASARPGTRRGDKAVADGESAARRAVGEREKSRNGAVLTLS